MKLYWIALFFTSSLFVSAANAASVTSWGGQQKQSLQSQMVGKWQLLAIYEDGENITPETSLRNYWIFKRNGWVEHNEEPEGLRRSNYWVNGRTLTIKLKGNKGTRVFRVSYVDKDKMIWKYRDNGKSYSYNLARY